MTATTQEMITAYQRYLPIALRNANTTAVSSAISIISPSGCYLRLDACVLLKKCAQGFHRIIACTESNCNCVMEKVRSGCKKNHGLRQNNAKPCLSDVQTVRCRNAARRYSACWTLYWRTLQNARNNAINTKCIRNGILRCLLAWSIRYVFPT